MENPLLDQSGLPRFGDIRVEHVDPAIESLLARNRAEIASIATLAAMAPRNRRTPILSIARPSLGSPRSSGP